MSTSPISHFLIGPPGSGKSTLANHLTKLGKYHLVSTDQIRQELYGDMNIQGEWMEIEAKVISQIVQAIAQGDAVIYDATNAKRSWRLDLLQKINFAAGCSVGWVGWYLKTPIAVCRTWNQQRTRQVSEEIIENMSKSLQDFPPVPAEGFIVVKQVDMSSPEFSFL